MTVAQAQTQRKSHTSRGETALRRLDKMAEEVPPDLRADFWRAITQRMLLRQASHEGQP